MKNDSVGWISENEKDVSSVRKSLNKKWFKRRETDWYRQELRSVELYMCQPKCEFIFELARTVSKL